MNPDPDEHTHPGQEQLEWGQGITEEERVDKPQTKYWAMGEKARMMMPHESLCKIFCGGKNCKYCTSDGWKKEQMAVNGLYSEWVTHNILAMARMSNENIKRFKMIKQLQNLQVRTVINLQQPGEHAHCGFGNDDSGFSYNPQTLMDAGFFFYNFTIQDYGVTVMPTLLDIVKVMQFALSEGKVAVHCHAGLGRTGLIIACYLIYNNRVKSHKAIQYVRSRRPGSIQTKQQISACQQFEEYLQPFFVIFSEIHAFSFSQFLTRQRYLLHGYEARKLKHIPKVIYVCCERLLELCGRGSALASLRSTPELSDLDSLNGFMTGDHSPCDQLSLEETGKFLLEDSKTINKLQLSSFNLENWKRLIVEDKPDHRSSSDNMRLGQGNTRSSDAVNDDDDCVVYGGTVVTCGETVHQQREEAANEEKGDESNTVYSASGPLEVMTSEVIWDMITKSDYPTDVLERLHALKETLNTTEQAWKNLASENNPLVISGLMCDWLDHLSGPVLRAQDVSVLIENSLDPGKALLHLEKSTRYFLEYIILVISKFDISSQILRHTVLEFFLSYLCQKRLNQSNGHMSAQHGHFTDQKAENAHCLFKLFVCLLERENKVM